METVKINVGGKIFETTRQTLANSSYFSSYFSRWNNGNIIFVDRSYERFEHVLAFLRNPNYDFPLQFKEELDFYGISNNLTEYEDEMTKLITKLNIREDEVLKLTNEIVKLTDLLKIHETKISDLAEKAIIIKDLGIKNGCNRICKTWDCLDEPKEILSQHKRGQHFVYCFECCKPSYIPVTDKGELSKKIGSEDKQFKGFLYKSKYYDDINSLIDHNFEEDVLFVDILDTLISTKYGDAEKLYMVYQDGPPPYISSNWNMFEHTTY